MLHLLQLSRAVKSWDRNRSPSLPARHLKRMGHIRLSNCAKPENS